MLTLTKEYITVLKYRLKVMSMLIIIEGFWSLVKRGISGAYHLIGEFKYKAISINMPLDIIVAIMIILCFGIFLEKLVQTYG